MFELTMRDAAQYCHLRYKSAGEIGPDCLGKVKNKVVDEGGFREERRGRQKGERAFDI
jgi:hypothetical protein